MKLQILIPQYKETEEVIKPLLDSIALQQNIDFKQVGVIITNDGTDVKLSEEFLSKYPYDIEYYHNEHKGVSATRNACLDKATADYVMFCDADDGFVSTITVLRPMDWTVSSNNWMRFDGFSSLNGIPSRQI